MLDATAFVSVRFSIIVCPRYYLLQLPFFYRFFPYNSVLKSKEQSQIKPCILVKFDHLSTTFGPFIIFEDIIYRQFIFEIIKRVSKNTYNYFCLKIICVGAQV